MQRNYFDPANVIHQQQQEQQQQILYAQQQTTAAAVNTIAVAPQAIQPHEMPVPSQEPWNINLMPWKLDASNDAVAADGVMKFSANRNNLEAEAMQRRLQLHHKRKSDIMPEHPPKQFISEEKFTAHFNGLHISSDYVQSNNNPMANFGDQIDPNNPTTSGVCFTNRTFEDYQVTARELEEKLLRANRITICDEVRRMHEEQKKISFLPEALMNRMEKPCKALVLWQPSPIDLLRQVNVPNSSDDESRRRLDVYQQQQEQGGNAMQTSERASSQNAAVGNVQQILQDYDEFSDNDDDQRDVEIDDYIDNNNTSSLDFNNLKADGMDEDL